MKHIFGNLELLIPTLLVSLTPNPAYAEDCVVDNPAVIAEDFYSNYFHASKALTASCTSTHFVFAHWVAPDTTQNSGFTLDYGEVRRADGFHLRNDNNQNFNDRWVIKWIMTPECLGYTLCY